MKLKFAFCLFFLSICSLIFQKSVYGEVKYDLEKEVLDPYHLSIEDYKKIQKCLSQVTDEDLPPMMTNRLNIFFRSVKFVGDDCSEGPIFEIVPLNNDPHDKKNCIVLYVSYNPPYPQNVFRFISELEKIGFNGHVIYRIGGYPNLENGSLKVIDVPYAFKACALQEANLLGYQNLLWIDCSLTPIRSLESLFKTIENQGYFAMTSGSNIKTEVEKGYINWQALNAMGIPYESSYLSPHITTPIFGLNMHSDIGQEILRQFYSMAEERAAFFCDWVDEAPLSAILYHMKLPPMGAWYQFMIKENENGFGFDHYFRMSLKRPEGRQ